MTGGEGSPSSSSRASDGGGSAGEGAEALAAGAARLGLGPAPGGPAPSPAPRRAEGGAGEPPSSSTESGGGEGEDRPAGPGPGARGGGEPGRPASEASDAGSGGGAGSGGASSSAAEGPGGPEAPSDAAPPREARAGEGLPPGSVKLFVGGLSWDTTEAMLVEAFGAYGGEEGVLDVVVMRDKGTGKPRGFGFVTVADQETADRVCAGKHTIDGRVVEAKVSVPPGESHGARSETLPGGSGAAPPPHASQGRKIFVGGLSPETTDDDFRCYFETFGDIVESQIMQDHMTGRSRGFGFITYATEEGVQAVYTHGRHHELRGKQVEVKAATPRKVDGKGGGKGKGGGRGGAGKGRGLGLGGLSVGLAGAGPSGMGPGGPIDQFGVAAVPGSGAGAGAGLGGYPGGPALGGYGPGAVPYGMYAAGGQGIMLPSPGMHSPGMAQGYPAPPQAAFPLPTPGTPPGYSFMPAEAYGGAAGAPQLVYGTPPPPGAGVEPGALGGLQPGGGHWVSTSPPVAGFAVAPQGGLPIYLSPGPPQGPPPPPGAAGAPPPQGAGDPPPPAGEEEAAG